MALVATLAEFKAHLNYTSPGAADDTELTNHLTAASEWMERTIGGPLAVTSFTEQVKVTGWWITPTYRPLVSVTSLTPELGGVLDPSSYVLDAVRNGIRIRWGALTGWYTLVYTAGLAAIPAHVKLAGLILAAHLWQTQSGGGGLPVPGDDAAPTYGRSFAVPNRVKELLATDVIPGFA